MRISGTNQAKAKQDGVINPQKNSVNKNVIFILWYSIEWPHFLDNFNVMLLNYFMHRATFFVWISPVTMTLLKLVRTPLNVYFTAFKSSFLSLSMHI